MLPNSTEGTTMGPHFKLIHHPFTRAGYPPRRVNLPHRPTNQHLRVFLECAAFNPHSEGKCTASRTLQHLHSSTNLHSKFRLVPLRHFDSYAANDDTSKHLFYVTKVSNTETYWLKKWRPTRFIKKKKKKHF